MPRVPIYERTERDRPAFQQGIDVRATPDAAGAGIGRAVQQMGGAVGQATEAVARIQAFDDENAAKDADNKFAEWARGRAYGEGGYLTLEGRNAVEGRAKFEEELEAKRREFSSGLRPGATRLYDTASRARATSLAQQAIVHQANERKTWFRETSDARRVGFANDALANYGNPELVTKNIAAGLLELDNRGQLEGWAPEELARQKSAFSSGVHAGVVTQLADADPIAADRYLTTNKDAILPADALKLRGMLEAPLRVARTDAWLQSAIRGAPAPDMGAAQNGDLLSKMLQITVQSESGGNPNAVSPVGARGLMQVMPGTMTDPGFGIRPSDGSAADTVRVGREYLAKMMERYDNDPAKAWAAYNWGPGNLDKAMKNHGSAWLNYAPQETRDYVRKNVAALGQGGGAPVGGASTGAFLNDLYTKADAISNPQDREAAYAAIDRYWNRQQRVLNTSRQQVIDDLERKAISDPSFDPDKLPVSMQQVIGMSGMNALRGYRDARLAEAQVKTDPVAYDELLTRQARDPEGFAKVDLLQYRSRLSDSDYMKLRGMQRDAAGDLTRAMRDGSVFRKALSIADDFYPAAGIVTGNGKNANSAASAAKKAQFNAAMRQEIEEYVQREGKQPGEKEIRGIASALTLRVVESETRGAWSPMRLVDDGQDDVWSGLVYQRTEMTDGRQRRVEPSYANVPAEWVEPIRQTLQQRSGGKAPTNAEIAAEWGKIALDLIGGIK